MRAQVIAYALGAVGAYVVENAHTLVVLCQTCWCPKL